MPFLSIVIPVYNSAETIKACMESIVYCANDTEVILSDDGSTDGSSAICDKYAELYDFVRVLHQKNSGASSARNTGLSAANGEYVLFVDSDDRVSPELWSFLPILRKYRPDCLGFSVRYESGVVLPWPVTGHFSSNSLLPYLSEILVKRGQFSVLYNKFYSSKLLQEVQFDPVLKINEDFLFNVQALSAAQSFVFCDQVGYIYNDTREGTLSRRLRTDLCEAEKYTRAFFIDFLRRWGCRENVIQDLVNERAADTSYLQFFVLTGCKGQLSVRKRKLAFEQCLSNKEAKIRVLQRLYKEKSVLSVPYIVCIRCKLLYLLSFYCIIKQRFI